MNEILAALRLRPVGDAALVAELGEGIDPATNARVRALDRALLERPFPGFVECVPTHRSLLVCFNPAHASFALAAGAIRECAREAVARDEPGRLHEIAVRYGGADGPDLEEVAARAGLSTAEVVRLHSGQEYSAFMLGFLPGFAYLGLLPERLDTPRLATPRTRVPAGSVAIAGRLTGIYPAPTPGGWRILGRASVRLFDASREPPSLICPGDRVRFVPVEALDDATLPPLAIPGGLGQGRAGLPDAHGKPGAEVVAEVLSGGLLTTVQGQPRLGHRRFGVAGAGALDPRALATANGALGNPRDAPGLECTLLGPTLRFLRPVRFALAGADLEARLERADLGAWPVPPGSAILARPGNLLTFGARRAGCRAYLAFEGGLAVPLVLGSPSTDLMGGFGGIAGRALAKGDLLAVGSHRDPSAAGRVLETAASRAAPPVAPAAAGPESTSGRSRGVDGEGGAAEADLTVRVVPGPQEFTAAAMEALLGTVFTVTASSDRIGYRLEGATLPHSGPAEIVSDGMVPGSIQVPPDGRPIVMLADGPTTGGYPKIATVVTSDLPRIAQLVPGSGRLRFVLAGSDSCSPAPTDGDGGGLKTPGPPRG